MCYLYIIFMTKAKAKQRAEKLKKLITKYRYQRLATQPLEKFAKFIHPERMLSLNDAFDENDMMEWRGLTTC